ncbi:MAG: hypothetical protein IID28_12460, partial [Planctomycetes bacterium]|nr:hypothetical protein [Planctomycetota bacterium]
GGMYSNNGSPTVTDCIFIGNTAGQGGGLFINIDGSPTVTGCSFSGNSADEGGGMYSLDGSPTVTDSTFCDNSPQHIDGPLLMGGQIQMSDTCPIPVCTGDIDGDGTVGITDFLQLLGAWGPCP